MQELVGLLRDEGVGMGLGLTLFLWPGLLYVMVASVG